MAKFRYTIHYTSFTPFGLPKHETCDCKTKPESRQLLSILSSKEKGYIVDNVTNKRIT